MTPSGAPWTPACPVCGRPVGDIGAGQCPGCGLPAAARAAGVQALLLVEHDIDLVEAHATRVVGLRGGRMLADLPARDFFADEEATAALVGRRPAKVAHA